MASFLKMYWISIALCIFILILCFIKTEPLPRIPVHNFDKLVHLLMFLGLSGTVFFDGTRYFRRQIRGKQHFIGSFLFPVLFGGLIEIMQAYFTTTRTGDWNDFLFDGIGAGIGWIICELINRRL